MDKFTELLKDHDRIILFDGAMGTYLYKKGVFLNVCYEELNIINQDMIKGIHEEYIKAGSDIITTNTFGANRIKLDKAGIGHKLKDIIVSAVRIAKDAAKKNDVLVAGDIGPLGKLVYPLGPISKAEAEHCFLEQIDFMLEADVDLFTLETFSDLNELELVVGCIQKKTSKPIIAHMTVTDEGTSIYGATPYQLVDLGRRKKIDVVGFNCSLGPNNMLKVVEGLKIFPDVVFSVQPNAGVPRIIDNRTIYLATPEYFTTYARRYMLNNVRIVGGCCGIHPEHIKELKTAVKSVTVLGVDTGSKKSSFEVLDRKIKFEGLHPVPLRERSHFAKRLTGGSFVSSVEITPPKGCNPQKVIESARMLKQNGVDAVNIPDGPRASARMSPQMLAVILEREVGMETIMHYCCRDRNVIGMQSDLLGAAAAGVNNILVITGDPPKLGHYPDATPVFDVDAVGLTRIVNRLNHGIDLAGNDIKNVTSFFQGVGVNPVATNYELELERFHQKVEAGAEFVITQPVFDSEKIISFLDDIKDVKIPVIAGIWPLASYRNAEFLNSEIPEVSIPQYILDRMSKVTDKEEAKIEGVMVARETIKVIKDRICGIQVNAPFGRVDLSLKVLEGFMDPDNDYIRT